MHVKQPTSFAGFEYPRRFAILPKGTPTQRLAKRRSNLARHGRAQLTGGYYTTAPVPNTDGRTFYMDSTEGRNGDFQPGLRWTWADEVEGVGRRLDHTGWWTEDEGGDKLRGLVFRLNHGRGFLAGYSMGAGMISEFEYTIYPDEVSAAYAADSMAEHAAEKSREAWEREQEEGNDE